MQKTLSAPQSVPRENEKALKGNTKSKAIHSPEETFNGARAIHWPEGLTPLPNQVEAVEWALSRKNSYLALDAGLGKTIVAAIIANRTKARVYYICPPFLVQNTHAEFDKWTFKKNLYTIPDSMISKMQTLKDLRADMTGLGDDEKILIIDEAHRFKNEKSQRSDALYCGILPMFSKSKVVFMSGTPMPNSRPIELWPVIRHAALEVFNLNRFSYGVKFCGGFKDTFGWNFDGFTNKQEFKARLFKTFMLRQKKELLNLPPKLEGLLTVGDGMPPVVSKIEKKILEHYSPEDLVEGKIAAANGEGDLHLATYLRLLGEYKVKYVVPFIQAILEETKEDILIFAVHKAAVASLTESLKDYNPLVITGDVPKEKRQDIVNTYQKSKAHRVFIGNIQACGVGFTLTKATRVIFVEFSWVDGDNSQASDRAHRIGQNQSVLVQYVVLKDSFDRTRMEVLLKKRGNSI